MDTAAGLEKRELHVTEVFINTHVTLVYMPDLDLCDFFVRDHTRYVVHFLDPKVFGVEFATLHQGNNLFNVCHNGQTQCYLFDESQMKSIVQHVEGQPTAEMMPMALTRTGTVSPCTGPIIIPPTKAPNNG
jgi:hypothetical protein